MFLTITAMLFYKHGKRNYLCRILLKIKNFNSMKKVQLLLVFALFMFSQSFAQIKTPAPSPTAKVSQMVGLTEVNLEYSRPSMKDRAIFGKGEKSLVQYGKMWRTGPNRVTKITFSTDVSVGGSDVKKGTYAILTVPGKKEWTVNFYEHKSTSWSSYKEAEPAASFKVKSNKSPMSIETFTMMFGDMGRGTAKLHIMWEKTMVSIPMDTKVDAMVMKNAEKVLAGPTVADYYNLGSYMYDSGKTGKELEKALSYVQKATSVDKPRFWQVRKESLILAKLGKYKKAVKAAKKSLALAEEAKNADYVKMNKNSIKEWEAKM